MPRRVTMPAHHLASLSAPTASPTAALLTMPTTTLIPTMVAKLCPKLHWRNPSVYTATPLTTRKIQCTINPLCIQHCICKRTWAVDVDLMSYRRLKTFTESEPGLAIRQCILT